MREADSGFPVPAPVGAVFDGDMRSLGGALAYGATSKRAVVLGGELVAR